MAHVPALAMLPAYELRGLVASRARSATAAAIRHGVTFSSDRLDDLLARPDIDLVVVSVRVPAHRRIVEASLGAGKAVLCEWPLVIWLKPRRCLKSRRALRSRASSICRGGTRRQCGSSVTCSNGATSAGGLSTSVIAAAGSPWGLETVQRPEVMYRATLGAIKDTNICFSGSNPIH
jgi:GFO/IDH/MocA oxidoreductase family protein